MHQNLNDRRHSGAARISVFAFALALPTIANSQSTLHGRVLDPLGTPVSGASISQQSTNSIVSGPDGSYTLPLSKPCPCTLEIDALTFPHTSVTVRGVGQQDLTLASPTRSDEITVTATGTPTPLAQSGAPITILTESDYIHSPEIQQPLRLIPGVQITQQGGTGGVSSLFMRGADSGTTKVLIDGVPLNDVGGPVDFSTLASVGISQVEVLRQPSSALYGSDALAGVVSLTTARGVTPLPLISVALDGGNLGSHREEVSLSGAQHRVDFFTAVARLDTANNLPNDEFHNTTYVGNVGFKPDAKTDVRFILRHLATNSGEPNAFLLYGIPDAANQKDQDTYLSGSVNHQSTSNWHNLVRYGHESLNQNSFEWGPTGTAYYAFGYLNGYIGKQVTISGANGYSVSGQAILQYSANPSADYTEGNRDFVYAQSDYHVSRYLTALAAYKYEVETGSTIYQAGYPATASTVNRHNQSYTLQGAGDVASRLFYTLGAGIEHDAVYGNALTPRANVAYYAVRPSASTFFSGTKVHASFGKGLQESTLSAQNNSLYALLSQPAVTNGQALISQYGIRPIGAEYSRTYDLGVEQSLLDSRLRANLSWFHNEFTNGIQYVSQSALIQQLGIPTAVATAAGYGAYVNSQALRAQGAELEVEYSITRRIFLRTGYTYLDAVVQRSFSSDALSPSFNTSFNFGTIPIGVYAPLTGARPFRRAPHSGYFALSYAGSKLSATVSGTLVGRRDDSTFLTDKDYGNSLLLPNRNLDGAYQRLELTADYRLTHRITSYVNIQNLLNESYSEAFGYPALPINLRGGFKFTFGGETWQLK